MQINNHFTPTSLGHGSRPDHAANTPGRAQQFQPATADTEPATTTDTTNAVVPAEETEETEGPRIPGRSVAHQARSHLANLALSAELGGHNFGWLVSQIARNLFDPADYASDGEDTEGVVANVDVTDGGEATTTAGDTAPTGEQDQPADGTANAGTIPEPVIDETTNPVVDLVDALLEESEDEPAVT